MTLPLQCRLQGGRLSHLAPPASLLVALVASSLGARPASGPPLLGRRTSSFGASLGVGLSALPAGQHQCQG